MAAGRMWISPQAEEDPRAVRMQAQGRGLPAEALLQRYLPPVRPLLWQLVQAIMQRIVLVSIDRQKFRRWQVSVYVPATGLGAASGTGAGAGVLLGHHIRLACGSHHCWLLGGARRTGAHPVHPRLHGSVTAHRQSFGCRCCIRQHAHKTGVKDVCHVVRGWVW